MDQKDKKILEILKENSEYTTRQIAKRTLLPVTTVHNRIKKLKEQKIIEKFTIELDNSKIGKSFVAYVLISANLQLLKQKQKTQYDLAAQIRKFHFVERVDIVTGGTDLVAMVRVSNVEEFDKILLGQIQLIEGIDKTQSLIVIHEG